MKTNLHPLLLLLLIVCFSCGDGKSPSSWFKKEDPEDTSGGFHYSRKEASQFIREWVDSTGMHTDLPGIEEQMIGEELYTFYEQRSFKPAWQRDWANTFTKLANTIEQEGLDPQDFPLDSIAALLDRTPADKKADAKTGARLDILLSASYLKLADMIATGKVKPGDYYNSWHVEPQTPDTLASFLHMAAAQGRVEESLDQLRPNYPQYYELQKQLQHYRQIVEAGGWPEIGDIKKLVPGDTSQQLVAIRQRLHASGDLQQGPEQWLQPNYYDSSLVRAVQAYQERNGLVLKPEITPDMIAVMNIPAEKRLQQIMLNMDRIRWFSSGDLSKTYVLVNIPEYRLRVYENDREIKSMRVVVGAQMNSTPIFSDSIDHVIFSPYWNVPNSIASEEIIPKARANRNYLSRNHYEIVTTGSEPQSVNPSQVDWENFEQKYRIRQKPGPWNALGSVKFMFPNDFAIYLHDTPDEHLFERTDRAFSHGCIRIEEPDWFADWLLPQYNLQEVRQKITQPNSSQEYVKLEQKVPVYIFYLTAFVDQQGRMNFREDLYRLDEKLAEQFAGR